MFLGKCSVNITVYLDPKFEDVSDEEDIHARAPAKNKSKLDNSNDVSASKKTKQMKKPAAAAAADSSDDDGAEDNAARLQKVLHREEQCPPRPHTSEESDESVIEITSGESHADDSDEEDSYDIATEEEDEDEEDEDEEDEEDEELGKDEKPDKKKLETKKEQGSAEKKENKFLSGGISIEDTKVGSGPPATPGKFVTVYYEGRLEQNDKIFGKCLQGPGFKFRLGAKQVIACWDEGVVGMKVGGKRRIVCTPAMACGARGLPPVLPPNARLVFDMELKNVE